VILFIYRELIYSLGNSGKYIAALYSPDPPVTLPAQDFYISEESHVNEP
jgi:hypothetical protein